MPEVTVVEILKGALALAEAGQWCQGAAALDAADNLCSPAQPDANRFCMEGMLYRSWQERSGERLGSNTPPVLVQAFGAVAKQVRKSPGPYDQYQEIPGWNDRPERRVSHVIALLEVTIACLK